MSVTADQETQTDLEGNGNNNDEDEASIAELQSLVELGRKEIERLGENERYWMAKYDCLFRQKQDLLETK